MKRFILPAAFAMAAAAPLFAQAAVTVDIGPSGRYGRINIFDNAPPPQLIYPQPVVIQPVPVPAPQRPIYLHVPPGHAKDWRKHCGKYNACAQPVYFVQEDWYKNVYAPRVREDHDDHDKDHGKGHGKGHGKDKGKHKNKHKD